MADTPSLLWRAIAFLDEWGWLLVALGVVLLLLADACNLQVRISINSKQVADG